jgi:hypothetical protein
LYIGTSASEILHLVAIPADEEDDTATPTFILASRLQPSGHAASNDSTTAPGIQQILVFPGPLKACVLCNGVVSFYSLPEFSPAFPNREPAGVQWVGGLDENDDKENPEGPVVMIANSRRILQVRVGERLRAIKNNIEYPGCLRSSRRETIACVADDTSYSLLEVEHQQKIPLFPISSQAQVEEVIPTPSRSPANSPPPADAGHGRSTSMGNLIGTSSNRRDDSQTRGPASPHLAPPPSSTDTGSRAQSPSPAPPTTDTDGNPKGRPRAATDSTPAKSTGTSTQAALQKLKPHILSPFPSEFMLTTGTAETEPGVAMFVNLDGDVVRGTIEFQIYPEDLLVDNFSVPENPTGPSPDDEGQIVFALIRKSDGQDIVRGLEVQQLQNAAELIHPKTWVDLPKAKASRPPDAGLRHTLSSHLHSFRIARDLLQLVPLSLGPLRSRQEHDPRTQSAVEQLEQERALFESVSTITPVETSAELVTKRAVEESKFASRLGKAYTKNLVFQGRDVFMILQNPLISQLEYRLTQQMVDGSFLNIKPSQMFGFLASIHGREPKDETEFLTLNYIKQKTSLILFLHLQSHLSVDDILRAVENTLHDGGLDPRVPLLLLPPLAAEVL